MWINRSQARGIQLESSRVVRLLQNENTRQRAGVGGEFYGGSDPVRRDYFLAVTLSASSLVIRETFSITTGVIGTLA